MIRRFKLALLVGMASTGAATAATAASTDPLDFDYQIMARQSSRPALMFNDGAATYIQPAPGQKIEADGGQASGPYIVISGVPDEVRYSVNGSLVVARWGKSNSITAEPGNASGDLPRNLTGFSDRMAMLGAHGNLATARPMSGAMPLAVVVRSLVPDGWRGSAQKDIALTEETAFRTVAGENWLQSVDRLLAQRNLYAEVNFDAREIKLRSTPMKAMTIATADRPIGPVGVPAPVALEVPKAAAIPPVPPIPMPEAATAAMMDATRTPAAPIGSVTQSTVATTGTGGVASTLADAFGALAIRDNKSGRIEIRFAQRPTDLNVRIAGGSALSWDWDEARGVLSFPITNRFVVSGGNKSIEVARAPGIAYDFPTPNAAGLETVFEEGSATYLAFHQSVAHVNVFDDNHTGSGEHQDKAYKFNGISRRLTVIADGNVVTVERHPQIRFYERTSMVN